MARRTQAATWGRQKIARKPGLMRDNWTLVHAAFGTVLWIVCIGAAVVAVIGLISTRKTWDDFGKGGLLLDSEMPRGSEHSAAALRERDEEIRQMLEARNARRVARGQEPQDVEAQLAELLRPAVDPALEAEVRQLVIARNARRARAGKPPLDVEAEVARSLAGVRHDR